jgi:DnaJ family protein C protein 7
MEQFDASI